MDERGVAPIRTLGSGCVERLQHAIIATGKMGDNAFLVLPCLPGVDGLQPAFACAVIHWVITLVSCPDCFFNLSINLTITELGSFPTESSNFSKVLYENNSSIPSRE